jgi:hypothetical protein
MKALISKLMLKPLAFCDTRSWGAAPKWQINEDSDLELRLQKAARLAAARLEEWRGRCRERF